MIQALFERGVYQKDIAEELGVHPKDGEPSAETGLSALSTAAEKSKQVGPLQVDGGSVAGRRSLERGGDLP